MQTFAETYAPIAAVTAYAERMNARVESATTESGETLIVVMHDDHVFAAASSKVSRLDAYEKLAKRIKEKQS